MDDDDDGEALLARKSVDPQRERREASGYRER